MFLGIQLDCNKLFLIILDFHIIIIMSNQYWEWLSAVVGFINECKND